MRKINNNDGIYMQYSGFINGNEIIKLNTESISIQPFSEEDYKIDYYPKKEKKEL